MALWRAACVGSESERGQTKATKGHLCVRACAEFMSRIFWTLTHLLRRPWRVSPMQDQEQWPHRRRFFAVSWYFVGTESFFHSIHNGIFFFTHLYSPWHALEISKYVSQFRFNIMIGLVFSPFHPFIGLYMLRSICYFVLWSISNCHSVCECEQTVH